MLGNLIQTIKSAASKAMGGAADSILGLFAKPQLPTVKIEQRIQALYARGISDKVRLPGSAKEIVVHGTAGGDGSVEQFLDWQLGGEQRSNWNKGIGLVHFVIGRNGTIMQTIDPDEYWTWHSTSFMHDQETIGIELCNPSPTNANPYTDEQYVALAGLCDKIMRTNPQCKQIQSHNWTGLTYSGLGKNCPGSVFDWQRLINELALRKITARRIQTEVLSIA